MKNTLLIGALLLCCLNITAQTDEFNFTGKIYSKDRNTTDTAIGVSVFHLNGEKIAGGTNTDMNGIFSLKCKYGQEIRFSYVGCLNFDWIVTDSIQNFIQIYGPACYYMGNEYHCILDPLDRKYLSGYVYDKNKQPVPNAKISVENSLMETYTDSLGYYNVRVEKYDNVLIFHRNYNTIIWKPKLKGSQTTKNFKMKSKK